MQKWLKRSIGTRRNKTGLHASEQWIVELLRINIRNIERHAAGIGVYFVQDAAANRWSEVRSHV
jgi:hypothetical protein